MSLECAAMIGVDANGSPVACGLLAIDINGFVRCPKHHNKARKYAAKRRKRRDQLEYQQKQTGVQADRTA